MSTKNEKLKIVNDWLNGQYKYPKNFLKLENLEEQEIVDIWKAYKNGNTLDLFEGGLIVSKLLDVLKKQKIRVLNNWFLELGVTENLRLENVENLKLVKLWLIYYKNTLKIRR